jgi:hypothetical protein
VRIRNFFDNAYVFLGLYVTTFFSVSSALFLLIFATRHSELVLETLLSGSTSADIHSLFF